MRQNLFDGRLGEVHGRQPESIRLALLPPKANELLMTRRALFRGRRAPVDTRLSAGNAGSASPSHRCGGNCPSPVSASQQNAASMAPAAPSVWPVIGLVPLIAVDDGNSRAMTRLSISSFLRVAVACRVIYAMSPGL